MAGILPTQVESAPRPMDALLEATRSEPDDTVEIELDIESDDVGEDGVEPAPDLSGLPHGANIAASLPETTLDAISKRLIELIDEDKRSRKKWEDAYVDGLKLLGIVPDKKTEPWEGACNVVHPMLTEAALRFQSETIVETFPASGPVNTRVIGQETPQKLESARRVKEDMNYRLTTVMKEYRPEHEKALWTLALSGNAFKKVYDDPLLKRPTSMFVPPEKIVVNYGDSVIQHARRVTHEFVYSKDELKAAMAAGVYREVDLTPSPQPLVDSVTEKKDELIGAEQPQMGLVDDDSYTLYECHCELVIEGLPEAQSELAVPYVVTLDVDSEKVLGIYRNWKENDPNREKKNFFVHYTYVPGFGFYAFGLIHIIGGFADSATSILQQLIDAGSLATLQGGFKAKGLRIKGDDTPLSPGEWRDVDVLSGTLKENLLPVPYKEPSAVLAAMYDKVVQAGQQAASITDMKVAEMKQEAPVGTTLALLERTLKPMTAVQARVHAAMTEEFQLLKELIAAKAPQQYAYAAETSGPPPAPAADYAAVDVLPVSDPNATTMTQRIALIQAINQLMQGAPQHYDAAYVHQMMVGWLGVKNPEKMVPVKQPPPPTDPVTEGQNMITGRPVKAYPEQDHDAHLTVHMTLLQDESTQAMLGQFQNGPQIMSAMQAHILEHVSLKYKQMMERVMGVPMGTQPLPPEMEAEMSRLMARAAPAVQGMNKALAQAQEMIAQGGDPAFQLQKEANQIDAAEVLRKVAKDENDKQLKEEKNKIDAFRAMTDALKPPPPPPQMGRNGPAKKGPPK